MKHKITLIALLALFSLQVTAQKVNEKVQVEYNGSWHDATILKVDNSEGQYYITYDGWSDSWDEWVSKDRLKGYAEKAEETKTPLTKFKVGDKVEVEYGMVPAPATVVDVGENKYHIKFDNKLYGDKWVTEHEITKL